MTPVQVPAADVPWPVDFSLSSDLVVQVAELAEASGCEWILMGAGVCQTRLPVTKKKQGLTTINFGSTDPYISDLQLPGINKDRSIAVYFAGTGGPVTKVLQNNQTGPPILHNALQGIAIAASTAIYQHVQVRSS